MAWVGILLGFLLCAASLIPRVAAMEPVNVATLGYGVIELPLVVAIRNGYFRSERLEIQKIQIEPEIAVKALLAGEVQFSLAWEGSVRAAAAGLPIKVVAALVAKPPYVLMSRPEIRSGKDLRGKMLGIDLFGSTTDYLSRIAMRYLGIGPANVQFVEIGNSSQRIAALKTGEIQATSLDLTATVRAEEEGFVRLVQMGDIIDYPLLGVAVTEDYLNKKREQTKKFVGALLRSARFIRHKRVETMRIIRQHLKVPAAQAAKSYESAASYFTEDGTISGRVLALSVWRTKKEPQALKHSTLSGVADWSIVRELHAERRRIPPWLRQYDP